MAINLTKAERVTKRISLEKPRLLSLNKDIQTVVAKYSLDGEVVRVVLVLDGSGSMQGQYNSGRVQKVLDRMTAVALNFDDNGELESWLYASGHAKLGEVTLANLDDYVSQAMRGMMRTASEPAEAAAPAPAPAPSPKKKPGLLARIFGGGDTTPAPTPAPAPRATARNRSYGSNGRGIFPGLGNDNNEPPVMAAILEDCKSTTTYPTLVIFVTDGGIDKGEAIKGELIKSSHYPIFWQFVGIGGRDYGVLQQFDTMEGRHVDNANFFALDDIDSVSVAELYERLLGEFPQWLKKVREIGMLPPATPGK